MESRRFIIYHLIAERVKRLEKGWLTAVAACAALTRFKLSHSNKARVLSEGDPSSEAVQSLLELHESLNHPSKKKVISKLSLTGAFLIRLRRVYWALLCSIYAGWLIKLEMNDMMFELREVVVIWTVCIVVLTFILFYFFSPFGTYEENEEISHHTTNNQSPSAAKKIRDVNIFKMIKMRIQSIDSLREPDHIDV